MSKTNFDALIIGGGVNGAIIANCLSANGLKVALAEKNDFASFTSQESSNLIWGGIKYLENYELGLVNGLCKSRNQLMKAYPSRVKEIRFFATRYKGDKHWLLTYYLGAWLYQIIGRFFTKSPRIYSTKSVSKLEPSILTENASGSLEYSDSYLIDNDSRFIFQFIEQAKDNGANALNYFEVIDSVFENDLWTTTCKDHLLKNSISIKSKWLINAAGPFADQVNSENNIKTNHKHVFSKGVHLIVPKISEEEKVITFLSEDQRPVYIIPMQHRNCIGTTDTRVKDLPATTTDEDREFILRNINKHLKLKEPIEKKDIIAERCGVRPLVIEKTSDTGDNSDWLAISRKHQIDQSLINNSISIFGGKLTDCLNTALETLEIISKKISVNKTSPKWFGEQLNELKPTINALTPIFGKAQAHRLWRRYGPKSLTILNLQNESKQDVKYIFEEHLYFEIEIIYILNNEFVYDISDLLRRRTELSLIYKKEELKNNSILKNICQTNLENFSETVWDSYFKE